MFSAHSRFASSGRATRRLRALLVIPFCTPVLLAVACSNSSSSTASSAGGVASFAETPGYPPNMILPFYSAQYSSTGNAYQFQQLMYRPLYWFGANGKLGPNPDPSESLAAPPVYSDGNTIVTINMKPYKWSNGEPVTATDIVFFLNLMRAEKANWAFYVPGKIPDDIASATVVSPARLVLHLKTPVNPNWFTDDELVQITPLPEAWDITAPGRVGSCATSAAACPPVYSYLIKEAKSEATYAANPLWQVVDGPWRLKSFNTLGQVTFVPNKKYSGPDKPRLTEFREVPFTSAASEYEVLHSPGGGGITVGYVPTVDLLSSNSNPLEGSYSLAPWPYFSISGIVPNFNNPTVGALFRQLYIRQALAHVIDQNTMIRVALKGYGVPTYGPIPLFPPNPYLSPAQKKNPYPFSVSAAADLLRSHAWKVQPNGTSTCDHPGAGPNQCGPGISAGAKLQFTLLYESGVPWMSTAMLYFKSEAALAGIDVRLNQAPLNTVYSEEVPCTPTQSACSWQAVFAGAYWIYSYVYPTGEDFLATGAGSNYNNYSDDYANNLINATNTQPGLQPLYAYEDYMALQLPVIWAPNQYYQVTAISDGLKGATPQNPTGAITPEDWYFVR
jgi:peptide/nickel transport system substrate-binding protein